MAISPEARIELEEYCVAKKNALRFEETFNQLIDYDPVVIALIDGYVRQSIMQSVAERQLIEMGYDKDEIRLLARKIVREESSAKE